MSTLAFTGFCRFIARPCSCETSSSSRVKMGWKTRARSGGSRVGTFSQATTNPTGNTSDSVRINARRELSRIFRHLGSENPTGRIIRGVSKIRDHSLKLLCNRSLVPFYEASGGGEIRTHETFRPSGFQDRRNQPLCHPSRPNAHSRSQIHYPITPLLQVKSRSLSLMECPSDGVLT